METFLMIISSIAAILLIIIVLLQNSKGGGLDSSYGNVNLLGGVAQSTETIEKATWSLAGIIGFLSILAAFNFSGNVVENSTEIDQSEGVSLPSTNQPGNLPIDLPKN